MDSILNSMKDRANTADAFKTYMKEFHSRVVGNIEKAQKVEEVEIQKHKRRVQRNEELQEQIDQLSKELSNKTAILNDLKNSHEEEERHCNVIQKSLDDTQSMCRRYRRQAEPSTNDTKVLSKNLKRLKAYRQATDVKFYYPSIKHTVKGYIYNKKNNYVHAFEFHRDQISQLQITEQLWKEIQISVEDDLLALKLEEDENKTT